MRGEVVLVRAFGNRPVVRRVWAVDADVVLITDDEQFQRLLSNEPAALPIGFQKADVFRFDPQYAGRDRLDWSQLTPWSPKELENNYGKEGR